MFGSGVFCPYAVDGSFLTYLQSRVMGIYGVQHIIGPGGFVNGQAVDALGDETREIQPGRGYLFDGIDDFSLVPTDPSLANIFAGSGGGAVELYIKPTTGGSTGIHGLLSMGSAWRLYLNGETGGSATLNFHQGFSTTKGRWWVTVPTGSLSKLRLEYDNSDAANNPEVYIDNAPVSVTRFVAPVGTATNDAGSALYMGSHDGSIQFYKGLIAHVRLWKGSDLAGGWWGEESAGSASYDHSGNGNHGTITNATLSTFHAIDTDIPVSQANEVGYRLSGSTIIPRDESAPTLAADGNALTATGRVRYNASLVTPCMTLDGVDDFGLISGHTASDEYWAGGNKLKFKVNISNTVGRWFSKGTGAASTAWYFGFEDGDGTYTKAAFAVYYAGNIGYWQSTAADIPNDADLEIEIEYNSTTPTVAPIIKVEGVVETLTTRQVPAGAYPTETDGDLYIGSTITGSSLLQGSIWAIELLTTADVRLDVWPIQEGALATSYGQNGDHIAWTNITPATAWATYQCYPDNNCHWGITKGFRASGGAEIPALQDGSLAADGNPITNPAGQGHNGGRAKLQMATLTPTLKVTAFWAAARGYAEIVADYDGEHKTLANVASANKRNLATFSESLTGAALVAATRHLSR